MLDNYSNDMKFYKFIAIAFAGCAVIACSKNKAIDTFSNDPAWVNDNSLPVPIEFGKLGGFELETKAAVVGEGLYHTPFGIFGTDLEASDIKVGKLFNDTSSRLAQCESTENRLKFVESMDGDEVKVFYPIETKYNYTFYGYHIGSEDVEGEFDQAKNSYFKTVQLDDVDVLWAKAKAEQIDGIKGFNSKYFRTVRTLHATELEHYYPNLRFKHLTTAFHVKVRAFNQEAAETFLDKRVRVTKLSLTNVETKAKLIICDKSNESNEGTLVSLGEGTDDLVRENLEVIPTAQGVEVSDGFFVLPGDYSGSQLKFTLETDPEGTTQEYSTQLPLPIQAEQFEEGKSYTFIIIKSLEDIVIKASVDDWDEGFTQKDSENENDVIRIIE